MSGLSTIINIATSGVLAQQTAIAATAENVANITTPDFSRREVNFQSDPVPGQFSGVTADVTRAGANQFLQSSALSSVSETNALSSVADALSRITGTLSDSGDGLSFSSQIDTAIASLAELNASPASATAQIEAITNLDAAFDAFARTRSAITAEADQALLGFDFNIDRANQLLSEISTLNNQIGTGDNGGAQDALASSLSELSGLISISTNFDEIGRATVTTGAGRVLANANGFAGLVFSENDLSLGVTAISQTGPGLDPSNQPLIVNNIANEISGGSIGGALALLTDALPTISQLISSVEADFAATLNNAASGNSNFPASSILSASIIAQDAAFQNLSGQTSLARIDDNGFLLGRVDIDFDAQSLTIDNAGPISFVPTLDGLVSALDGIVGLSANLNGDLLSIEDSNGNGLSLANDSAGFSSLFGFNPIISSNGNGFEVNDTIRANPNELAAGRIDLSGVSIGELVTGANNGQGAATLFEAGRVQSENLANAIGQIGSLSVDATNRAAIAQAFNEEVSARLIEESGVNLEEELSNLILFQRSFNANARILSVADELYQSVLALI